MLQAELQQDIQRFSSEFTTRVGSALAPLQRSPHLDVRNAAMRQQLLYSAAALDIATGPQPELGLLDMIVFVTLSRWTVETYWVPKVFGDEGGELSKAMAQSEAEIWQLGGKILDKGRSDDLAALIRDWQERNPDQQRVEGVRFQTFSKVAGKLAEEQGRKTSGLLSSLKSATASADQAVLLAERAMFLVHREPFLLRMQARVGMHEIVDDMVAHLKSVEGVLDRADNVRPVIGDLTALVKCATAAAEETRRLVDSVCPPARQGNGRELVAHAGKEGSDPDRLAGVHALADKSLSLVKELRTISPGGENDIAGRIDGMVRRWLVYLLLIGAAWTVMFWGGYYIFRRLAD